MPRKKRCPWALANPLIEVYHDSLWGVPCHDEGELFRMLILEGKQAGLSWLAILRKMGGLLRAFDNFDPELMARYDDQKIESLTRNPEIIRHRQKILAAVNNAKVYLKLRDQGKTLDELLWSYVDGKTIVNGWKTPEEVPSQTPLSEKISRDFKALGFKFIGPTTAYALAQAIGLVNDHLASCDFRDTEGPWPEKFILVQDE
jgi:DNA-3-methyladenine glycosylase I